MAKAKQGDTVKINFTGRLADGRIFGSASGQEPLTFTIGKQEIMPSIEDAVIDMDPGERKRIQVSPEDGYGIHKAEFVRQVERTRLPPEMNPQVGTRLKGHSPSNQEFFFTVTEVTETTVTLDGNHPLAGKTLTFDIELVELI